MTRWYIAKTMGLAAIGGMLLAGMLAVAISEIDEYYDWLLVQQSIGLGLAAGLITGAGVVYYQKTKHTLNVTLSTLITTYVQRWSTPVERPNMAVEPDTTSKPGIWGTIGRSGLGGLLGLLLGSIGGIWYCIELYGNLSSDAQGWLIIYLPVYVIIAISCATMGCLVGAILGMVWGSMRSMRR